MKISVNNQTAALVRDDTLIENSSTIYMVEFEFDDSWDGYEKTAVFKAGSNSETVTLSDDICTIPSSCLKEGGLILKVGISGTKNGEERDTIWVNTSRILYNWESDSKGYSAPIRSGELVNHVAKFYTSSDKSGDPAFTMNIPEEMFLDQTKTEFVNDFVWSLEEYPGSTDPDLDGKPVFVLAVKGEDPESPPSYSFLDMDMAGGGGGDLPDDIYDMLPYNTVSGETVEFNNGAENIPVKSFIVDLGPKKAGGDSDIISFDPVSLTYDYAWLTLPKTLVPGTYTISFDVDPLASNENAFIFIGLSRTESPSSQSDIAYQNQFSYPELNSHVVHTFTTNYDANFVTFGINGVSSSTFSNIKLVAGNEPAGDDPPPLFDTYTSVNVVQVGKSNINLYDGPVIDLNANSQYTTLYEFNSPLESDTYIISGSLLLPSSYVSGVSFGVGFYKNSLISDSENIIVTRVVTPITDGNIIIDNVEYTKYVFEEKFVLSESAYYMRVNTYYLSIIIKDFSIQKQFANDINIEFTDNVEDVYCGKLNILTGELKVTHGFFEFDGTETWMKYSSYFGCNFIRLDNPYELSSTPNGFFSIVPYLNVQSVSTGEGAMVYESSEYDDTTGLDEYYAKILIRISGHENDSYSEFKEYIASLKESGTPLQAVYELGKPIVYKLSENEIKSFLGKNTFTSDASGMTITYRAEPTPYIESYVSDYVADAIDKLPKYALMEDVYDVYPNDILNDRGYYAYIPDGADNVPVKSFVIDFNVRQNGTDTPSVSNFRDFTAYSNVTEHIEQRGVDYCTPDDIPPITSTNPSIPVSIPAGRYSVEAIFNIDDTNMHGITLYVYSVDPVNMQRVTLYTSELAVAIDDGKVSFGSFTLSSDANLISFSVNNASGRTLGFSDIHIIKRIELDISLEDAGDFYGGELDVLTGELRITHAFKEIADVSWTKTGSGASRYFYTNFTPRALAEKNSDNLFSILPSTTVLNTSNDGAEIVNVTSSQSRLCVRIADQSSKTSSQFKTYIDDLKTAGTPLQVVYKLATPITYQLSENEVKTFLGRNVFNCYPGSMSFEYRADTDLYIDKKLQEESIGYVVKFSYTYGALTCNKSYSEIFDRWNNYDDVVGIFEGKVSSSILYSENLDNAGDYEYPTLLFSFANINILDTNRINILEIAVNSMGGINLDESFYYRFEPSGGDNRFFITPGEYNSDNGFYNVDKTVAEILDAVDSGKNVYLVIAGSGGPESGIVYYLPFMGGIRARVGSESIPTGALQAAYFWLTEAVVPGGSAENFILQTRYTLALTYTDARLYKSTSNIVVPRN